MKIKLLLALELIVPLMSFGAEKEIIDELQFDYDRSVIESRYKDSIFNKRKLEFFHNLDVDLQKKWTYAFLENSTSRIQFVKNEKKFKIFGEAFLDGEITDKQISVLQNNLQFSKENGYNGTILRFDSESDVNDLNRIADIIHSFGMYVISTYTGKNWYLHTKWKPYCDPIVLSEKVKSVASKSDAWLLNWRCTSQHEILFPNEFYNFLCFNVRQGNKEIPIYGEIFSGTLALGYKSAIVGNLVDGINGYVIQNIGYYGYNINYAINTLYPKYIQNIKDVEKIGVVVGKSPYYRTSNDLHLTQEEALEYKHTIENEFKSIGCMTITYFHDGLDDNHLPEYNKVDNILYNEDYITK